jgi:hypothetical protein
MVVDFTKRSYGTCFLGTIFYTNQTPRWGEKIKNSFRRNVWSVVEIDQKIAFTFRRNVWWSPNCQLWSNLCALILWVNLNLRGRRRK